MAITSALVLLAVSWFMTLFFVIPFMVRTQAEDGEVVPGTHESAPADFKMRRVAWRVTLIAVPIWIALVLIILSGVLDPRKFDWTERLPAVGTQQ